MRGEEWEAKVTAGEGLVSLRAESTAKPYRRGKVTGDC